MASAEGYISPSELDEIDEELEAFITYWRRIILYATSVVVGGLFIRRFLSKR